MTAGYFPLFRRFLESSIMDEEVSTRFLWLAMLLKADRQGIVHGTPKALARLANMSISDVADSLVTLQSPDPDSTSEEDDGRRVKQLSPNKWLLINYEKYRELAQKDRDRQLNAAAARRYREGLRGGGMTEGDGHGASSSVTERHGAVMDSASVLVSGSVSGVANTKKSTPKKKRSVFKVPTLGEVKAYILEKGLAVDAQDFIDFYESKGWIVGKGQMKDWRAACRRAEKWETNVKKFQGQTFEPIEANDESKGRKILMRHIMKHAMSLMKLGAPLNDTQMIIVNSTAEAFEALSESDMPKGLMEQKFYTIHDGMMNELFESLSKDDRVKMSKEAPKQVKFKTWVRKELQKRFGIPEPLDYELEG
jgi:hypothetical protein